MPSGCTCDGSMALCPRCRALAERAGLACAGGGMAEKAMLAELAQAAGRLGMYSAIDWNIYFQAMYGRRRSTATEA